LSDLEILNTVDNDSFAAIENSNAMVNNTAMEKTIDAPFHDFHRCSAVLFLSTLF
jgi:hypothetical protein